MEPVNPPPCLPSVQLGDCLPGISVELAFGGCPGSGSARPKWGNVWGPWRGKAEDPLTWEGCFPGFCPSLCADTGTGISMKNVFTLVPRVFCFEEPRKDLQCPPISPLTSSRSYCAFPVTACSSGLQTSTLGRCPSLSGKL